jgi:hypothetical protein
MAGGPRFSTLVSEEFCDGQSQLRNPKQNPKRKGMATLPSVAAANFRAGYVSDAEAASHTLERLENSND